MKNGLVQANKQQIIKDVVEFAVQAKCFVETSYNQCNQELLLKAVLYFLITAFVAVHVCVDALNNRPQWEKIHAGRPTLTLEMPQKCHINTWWNYGWTYLNILLMHNPLGTSHSCSWSLLWSRSLYEKTFWEWLTTLLWSGKRIGLQRGKGNWVGHEIDVSR